MESGYRKNLNVLVPCFIALAIMFGLVAYSPELYRAFCGATGYGGTTQRAYSDPTTSSERTVTVGFDSNVAPGLPWRFEPERTSIDVKLGQVVTVYYAVTNEAARSTTGQAGYNVSPPTAGIYFEKINCFCFTEQTLQPGETRDMAVVFYVDPKLAKDSDQDKLSTITLSYTFYPARSPEPPAARSGAAPRDAAAENEPPEKSGRI